MTSVARINWGEKLETKIAMLPESPGCYLMKDAEGTIIYVGKAVNLKNRVRSYFRDTEHGHFPEWTWPWPAWPGRRCGSGGWHG